MGINDSDIDVKPESWTARAKMIGIVAGSLMAVSGAVAAYNDYVPATRGFVVQHVSESQKGVQDRVNQVERRTVDTQLQVNTLRLEGLRKEKFDLGLKLPEAKDIGTRSLIEQRLNQINDDLGDVQREREGLRANRP